MSQRRTHKSHARSKRTVRPRSDAPVYIVFVLLGAGIWLVAWLLTAGRHAGPIVLGYTGAVAWLAHLYAFNAYRGSHLANWQKALAALPLRTIGYGRRGGKPVDAAHNDDRVKTTLVTTGSLTVVLLLVLAFLLVPEMRAGITGG